MSSRFSVRVDVVGRRTVRVRAAGEIDAATADSLGRALEVACRHGAVVVVVDLRGVTFCDGAGVGTLAYHDRRARQQGIDLQIKTSRPVERVLDLVGVASGLHLKRDID